MVQRSDIFCSHAVLLLCLVHCGDFEACDTLDTFNILYSFINLLMSEYNYFTFASTVKKTLKDVESLI